MTAGESIMLSDDEAAAAAFRLIADHVRYGVEMLPEWEDVPLLDDRAWRKVAARFRDAAETLDRLADDIDAMYDIDSAAILKAARA